MQKTIQTKKLFFIVSILSFGLFSSLIIFFLIQKKKYKIYNEFLNTETSDFLQLKNSDELPKHINNYITQISLLEDIKTQNFLSGLQKIEGESSIDYYNRGIIYLMRGYQESLKNTVDSNSSGLILIQKAYKSFDIAQKLSKNQNFTNKITQNQNLTENIKSLMETTNCRENSKLVIQELETVKQNLQINKELLLTQKTIIQANQGRITTTAGEDCNEKLINNNQTQLQNTINNYKNIKNTQNTQSSFFLNSIKNRESCNFNPNTIFRQNLYENQKNIVEEQKNTEALNNFIEKKQSNMLQKICEQEQNDGDINNSNQNLNETIDQIQKLNEDYLQNSIEKTDQETTNNEKLKLNEQFLLDQNALKQEQRIEYMGILKSEQNYDSQKYIQQLFQIFYGNTDNF